LVASGIRLGTPALTTRGFLEEDFRQVAHWIDQALSSLHDDERLSRIREEIKVYLQAYPLPYKPAAPSSLGHVLELAGSPAPPNLDRSAGK
ncbi:MAG: hypothetical protein D6750_07690, partial [Bacteroidetes bacterium]